MLAALGYYRDFINDHPLTKTRKLAAWGRIARWQIRSRLSDEVLVPWVGGTKVLARRGMLGITGNIYAGLHDFAGMGFTIHFLREGDLFADVGANVGSYTVLAGGVCKARVVAFEPDPNAAATLRRNIRLNDIEGEVIEAAASDHNGGGFLDTSDDDTKQHVADIGIPIALRTLDSALSKTPTFIKIDAEGHDASVLAGASRLIADPALKAVLVEDWGAVASLKAAGFSCFRYDPLARSFEPRERSWLCIRDLAVAEARIRSAPRLTVLGRSV